jgi:cobalamin biosynthesis protein CobD/CbiB
VIYVPTAWVGRVVAWLAEGYRTATALERALIFPAWAILRGVFIVGWTLAHMLHSAALLSHEQ